MNQLQILQITILILLAVGFLLKKLSLVTDVGQKQITDLVIYVVLPSNIITSFLTDTGDNVLFDCAIILAISVGVQVLSVILGKLLFRKQSEERRKSLKYATICSNAGFLGNPVAEGLFGEIGLMYAGIYLIPLRIMMWSEGIAIFSGEKSFGKTIKKVLLHPCVIACEIGIILMLTKVELPSIILTPLQTLGRCNTALSMLVIGMILADIDLKKLVDKTVAAYTVLRLVLIPLVVYVVCLLLPINDVVRGVCVILAAMPAGATTSMLAAKYECDPEFATKLVVFSTVCSIPAIIVWSMILV